MLFKILCKGEIFLQSVAFLKQVFTGVKEKATGAIEKPLESEQISMQIREVLKQIEFARSIQDKIEPRYIK